MIFEKRRVVELFSIPTIFLALLVSTRHDLLMRAQAADGCDTNLTRSCRSDIIEIPRGQMDGANSLFTLGATPISPFDVRVTKSGVVLSWGQDFVVEGRTLKFAERAVPSGADVLRVSYQSQFGVRESDVSSRGAKLPSVTNIDSIVDAALLRAVLRQHVDASQSRIEAGGFSEKAAGHDDDLRSLSMLATRVSSAAYSTAIHRKRSGQEQMLTGADGLGDNLPLIYSVLGTASPLGLIEEAPTERDSGALGHPPAKALGMLEQRLNDTEPVAPGRRTK